MSLWIYLIKGDRKSAFAEMKNAHKQLRTLMTGLVKAVDTTPDGEQFYYVITSLKPDALNPNEQEQLRLLIAVYNGLKVFGYQAAEEYRAENQTPKSLEAISYAYYSVIRYKDIYEQTRSWFPFPNDGGDIESVAQGLTGMCQAFETHCANKLNSNRQFGRGGDHPLG